MLKDLDNLVEIVPRLLHMEKFILVKWYLEKSKDISFEELTLLPSEQFIAD